MTHPSIHARAHPDKIAYRMAATGKAISYRELDDLSGRAAAGLRETGLSPGKVVALQLPNIPQFLIAYFGALKAGLVVLPLNPLLMAPELEYHLTDSAAALLIGFEGLHAEAVKACETTGVPLYLVSAVQGGDSALPDGTRPVTELVSTAPLDEPGGDVEARGPDDTAVLVYTSGTTGKPKGAELTHFQLYMNCTVAGGLFGARSAVLGDQRVRPVRRLPVDPAALLSCLGACHPRGRPLYGHRRRADHAARPGSGGHHRP